MGVGKTNITIILVTGGRDYDGTDVVFDCLTHLDSEFERMIVVHGDAEGADTLAYNVCREVGIEQVRVPAAWKKFNRAAGPIRNTLMIDLFDVDLVLAFPGGTGTANMKKQADERGIDVLESVDLLEIIRGGESQK